MVVDVVHAVAVVADALGAVAEFHVGVVGVGDDTPVMHKDFVSPMKSIGHGITCTADLENEDEVWKVMLELSQDIGHRLRVHKLKATGVQISIRSNDLGYRQFQAPLTLASQNPTIIAKKAFQIFQDNYRWTVPVRAVTVRAINLKPKSEPEQLVLFTDIAHLDRLDRLDDCIEEIRRRFGKKAIFQACLLGDLSYSKSRHMFCFLPKNNQNLRFYIL